MGIALIIRLLDFYNLLIFARVMLSWIPNLDPYNPLVRLLRQVTDPVLEPARRLIPTMGGMDMSPIVVFFGIIVLQRVLIALA